MKTTAGAIEKGTEQSEKGTEQSEMTASAIKKGTEQSEKVTEQSETTASAIGKTTEHWKRSRATGNNCQSNRKNALSNQKEPPSNPKRLSMQSWHGWLSKREQLITTQVIIKFACTARLLCIQREVSDVADFFISEVQ